MSRIIDVSLTIGPDLLVYPDNPEPSLRPELRIADGDAANVSELRMGTHTGTHVDPPLHFIEGADGMDRVPLEALVGPAWVVDMRGRPGPIGPDDLDGAGIPHRAERVLMRTDNSELWRKLPVDFPDSYVALAPEGARWVIEHGLKVIGTDFLGIEQRGAPGHPVHTSLLQAGVLIVEGLNLGDVEPGEYTLYCLPLKVEDGDGGPARAVLISS